MHKDEDWKHHYNLADSERYTDIKKGDAIQGDAYKAAYVNDKITGKSGGKLTHIWEMDAKNIMAPLRERVYQQGAKDVQRKFHLMMDNQILAHHMKVQIVQNDRLYKEKYNKETLGKSAADPGIAYPFLFEQQKLTNKLRPSEYEADAKARMVKTDNHIQWEELARARKVALTCKDSEYRKSRDEAIRTMKGFQQLDIMKNPYMNRHIINSENLSQSHYTWDWDESKDLVFFPVEQTERYEDMQKESKLRIEYGKEAKKNQMKANFDQVYNCLCDAVI